MCVFERAAVFLFVDCLCVGLQLRAIARCRGSIYRYWLCVALPRRGDSRNCRRVAMKTCLPCVVL